MSENPFQSPVLVDESEPVIAADGALPPITTRLILKTTWRWVLICSVSAIPSFMLGFMVTNASVAGTCAMCVGILLFASGYSLFDLHLLRRWCYNSPSFHRALRIALGFRMTASVIFPFGAMIDMYPGFGAVAIFNAFGNIGGGGAGNVSFPVVIGITLVQGLFMNLLLYAFVLLVFTIIRLTNGELFRTRSESTTSAPPV